MFSERTYKAGRTIYLARSIPVTLKMFKNAELKVLETKSDTGSYFTLDADFHAPGTLTLGDRDIAEADFDGIVTIEINLIQISIGLLPIAFDIIIAADVDPNPARCPGGSVDATILLSIVTFYITGDDQIVVAFLHEQ